MCSPDSAEPGSATRAGGTVPLAIAVLRDRGAGCRSSGFPDTPRHGRAVGHHAGMWGGGHSDAPQCVAEQNQLPSPVTLWGRGACALGAEPGDPRRWKAAKLFQTRSQVREHRDTAAAEPRFPEPAPSAPALRPWQLACSSSRSREHLVP